MNSDEEKCVQWNFVYKKFIDKIETIFFSFRHNCVPDTALDSCRKSISCFDVSAGDDSTNHFNFFFFLCFL